MATPRKPIPKYQLTLSEGKHRAFKGIEGQGIQTNPNEANIPVNPNYDETGIDFNVCNNKFELLVLILPGSENL